MTDSLNTNMHNTFQIINELFKANLLSLNYEKTQCVQFRTKNSTQIDSKVIYINNAISNVSHTKYLGLVVDNTLSWNSHIEGIVNKLSCLLYVYICSMVYVPLISNDKLLCSGQWQDVLPSTRLLIWMHERNTIKLHAQIFLRMNTWMLKTCQRHYKSIKTFI